MADNTETKTWAEQWSRRYREMFDNIDTLFEGTITNHDHYVSIFTDKLKAYVEKVKDETKTKEDYDSLSEEEKEIYLNYLEKKVFKQKDERSTAEMLESLPPLGVPNRVKWSNGRLVDADADN